MRDKNLDKEADPERILILLDEAQSTATVNPRFARFQQDSPSIQITLQETNITIRSS